MNNSNLIVIVFLSIFGLAYSAVFHGRGQCPNGKRPGEVWQTPGECMSCSCNDVGQEAGYSCQTCGAFDMMVEGDNCYLTQDTSLDYPRCCDPQQVCRGDEAFDGRMHLLLKLKGIMSNFLSSNVDENYEYDYGSDDDSFAEDGVGV